jgi:hypothetical protein
VGEPQSLLWSLVHTQQNLTDVRVEVDATKQDGSDNDTFGIICRASDSKHFYIFLIASDGSYRIVRYKPDDNDESLGSSAPGSTAAILQGKATNHIRADCVGNTLTLYVNSQKLLEVQDAEFKEGQVGLAVFAARQKGADILFDNFIVMKP